MMSGSGAPVRRLWKGLPPDLPRIHAVLERRSDHAIVFISGALRQSHFACVERKHTVKYERLPAGSRFWLFRDLALQDGYPQPLSALRTGVSLGGGEEEEEPAGGRWGLLWDPEEGPVWGHIGDAEGDEQEDVWTQLLRQGVSGITTGGDGEDRHPVGLWVT